MLSQDKLAGELTRFFSEPKSSYLIAGAKMARAFSSYAALGQSVLGGTIVPGQLEARTLSLGKTLAGSWAKSRSSNQFAHNFANALSTFWLGVTFTGSTPGAVTAAGSATLFSSLQTILARTAGQSGIQNPRQIAHQWAQAIHAWNTSAVITTHPPPSPGVGPMI